MLPRSVDEPTPTSGQYPALYMVIVVGLVLVALLTVVGALVLSYVGKSAPDSVVALAGAAIGFVGGLLVPSPKA